MQYTLDSGKTIRIPDDLLAKMQKNLNLSKEEAIEVYLEDEGYLENDEQIELDKKAKASEITRTIHGARAESAKKRTVTRKADTTKEGLIADLAEWLADIAQEVKIENIGKLITFKLGEDTFKLDLIRQRKPKEKK